MPEAFTKIGLEHARGNARGGKILLVDEDALDLQLYAAVLRKQGHLVECCATYLEGAERLERAEYDLIILSQGGRSFEGRPLLERAIELDRHRPVLVLTRTVDMQSYLDVMYLGAYDYMEKPPAPWEIIKMVSNCLSHRVEGGAGVGSGNSSKREKGAPLAATPRASPGASGETGSRPV
jgi:DNA-binding NtrC family response regulator